MKVTCPSCQKGINIQDDKLPPGKTVKFNCPFCKNLITTRRELEEGSAGAGAGGLPDLGGVPESTPSTFHLDETQNVPIANFGGGGGGIPELSDAFEDEMDILEEGTARTLLADTENAERLTLVLKKMNYLVTAVKTADEALRKLQFNKYEFIIVNERFGGQDPANNPVLKYIEPLTMDLRRHMFVALIGKNFKTLDALMAFAKSVNIVVNEADFSNLELIFKKAYNDNETFYRAFKKAMVETGKE
ncbi:MAG: zinc-ribbon domain-containing protein [Nitrospinae bacterium]|nr:zinc-ribbon domain-containing protein [Nitrospinota bacterium]